MSGLTSLNISGLVCKKGVIPPWVAVKIKWDDEFERLCELCGVLQMQGVIIIWEIEIKGI